MINKNLIIAKKLMSIAQNLVSADTNPPVVDMSPKEFETLSYGDSSKEELQKIKDVMELETVYTQEEEDVGYGGGYELDNYTDQIIIRVPGTVESIGEPVEYFKNDTFRFDMNLKDGSEVTFEAKLKDIKNTKEGFVDFLFYIDHR